VFPDVQVAYGVALAVSSIACVTDLRNRRIPNVLTFGAALGGSLPRRRERMERRRIG